MKKSLLFLSALSICGIAIAEPAATNTIPVQEQKLAEWVKEKKSIDEILKDAAAFNAEMKNPVAGIACGRNLNNRNYEVLTHPNNEKMTTYKHVTSGQDQKVWSEIFATVKDKKPGESGSLSYTYEGNSKQAEVYRINNNDVCLAFWLAPAKH